MVRETILIGGDHSDVTSQLVNILRGEYDIQQIESGREILRQIHNLQPALVILMTDLNTPDIYALCTDIRSDARCEYLPILFVGTSAIEVDQVSAFNAGGLACVNPPLNAEIFSAQVASFVKLSHRSQKLKRHVNGLSMHIVEQNNRHGVEPQDDGLMARFIEMVSHEFRTPLAVILSATEALDYYADRLTEAQKAKRFTKIRNQVHHLTMMLTDILTLEKIETNDFELNPQPLAVDVLLESMVEQYSAVSNTEIFIDYDFQTDCQLNGDELLIKLILNNLLSNAVKYNNQNKPVEVMLLCEMEGFTLTIKDAGIGIPQEDIPHLFSPFFRARNTVGKSGIGLGLHIAKHAIELHRGRISFQTQLNTGTTFSVWLPRMGER